MSDASFSVAFAPSEADVPETLWDAGFPPPLEGRWWYRALERSNLEDQFTFAYAVISQGERPVGLAPTFIMNVPLSVAAPPLLRAPVAALEEVFPRALKPRTLFVGSPCSDEGTVGIVPGVDRRAVMVVLLDALLAEAKRAGAPMVVWKDLPAAYDSDMVPLVATGSLFRMVSYPNAVVELPPAPKANYWNSLKSSRRNKLKKKLRLSYENADLDVTHVAQPDSATIARVFELFTQTYRRAKVRFERLPRNFFDAIAAEANSFFLLLRERRSGEIVAFMLCFDIGDRVVNKFIGIDYTRPREWFLYFRLWEAVLDHALARGASSIQSGQTAYSAKIEVGHKMVRLTNYGRHKTRAIHGILGAIARRTRWETLDSDLAAWLAAHPAEAIGQQREPTSEPR